MSSVRLSYMLMVLAGGHLVTVDGANVKLPVWEQTATISEYIYKREIPELTGFTMCMWYKGTNPTRTSDHPISISNQVTDNEVMVYFGSQNQLTLYLQGTNYHTPVCDANELDGIMLNWNKQCYAWTSGGTFSWYVTYNDPDTLEVYRSIATGSHTLRSSMNLILFQEQDSEMGGLNVGQCTEAYVAWFNFWDYELSATQLNALTCESVGNLFTITDMMFAGAGHFTYTDSFECGDVKKHMDTMYTRRLQQKTMCKVTGAKLSNHVLTTVTTNTPALCVAKCSSRSECMSANYNLDDGACDLNDMEGRDYIAADDFADNSASNLLYFSSLEC